MANPALKPKALRPGDTVMIVTPASPLTPEKTEFAQGLLEKDGYKVCFGDNAFAAEAYLAGPDEARAKDLQAAFDDPNVGAVLCSRGGYGCARILPFLDLDRMAASRKLFLGFSDITTLHLALNRRGLPTVHAPMPLTLHYPRETWVYDSFLACLRGEMTLPKEAPRAQTMVPGMAEGAVTGGCLCLLTDSIGTSDALDCAGKIVIIEDVDENPHRVDAMLTHLLLSNTIQKAAGIVIGEMTRTDERQDEGIGGMPWRDIVRNRLATLGIPMVVDYPFGHCKNMVTLPLGVRARLDADAGMLTYLENLCA